MDGPLDALLDAVAAPVPAPGGGSCAGWAAALSAALIEMAAGCTLARPRAGDDTAGLVRIRDEAAGLRARASELADRDPIVYARVLIAQRVSDAVALEAALDAATDIPLEIAQVAAGLATLALAVLEKGKPSLRGDAQTALQLADASCRAAAGLVEINLAADHSDQRVAAARALVDPALARCRRSAGG